MLFKTSIIFTSFYSKYIKLLKNFQSELRSFYDWTSTKTGKQRIEKWLLSKYGRSN
jgi:hypothetical protein